MAGRDAPEAARLLALLAEAERHAVVTRSPRAGAAGFVLGSAIGLLLGRTDPDWAAAALDEFAWTLAAGDGRSPAAHQAELRAAAQRVLAEAAAIEAGEHA
jgi:hypothetical protein